MPRFSYADALAIVLQHPIVPVFYHADAAYATRILQACYDGGLRVFEFTNRGEQALSVFTELAAFVRQHLPGMLLGIGTIYTAAQAEEFIAAGADFVVQPVTTADVAAVCRTHALPWLPGALTVNEIYQATQLGATVVKIFPGNMVGPGYVKALRGPMPHVRLMVTGGVEPTEASLNEWFGAGVNVVGMGSQLFKNVDDTAAFTALVQLLLGWARA
jgi:2-dehydro-3-deoxyphosphogluconate aldolase/(4S)-4-hydroxy-2-oxoglutarate aldolase